VSVRAEEKTHVLLVGMRGILGGIVREIVAQEPDMEIVGELGAMSEVRATGRLARLGVVVVRSDDEPGSVEDVRDLLGRHPQVTILTVQGDGRHGAVYRLRPEKAFIGDLSPASLMTAIRAGAASRALSA
jgi:hypothetical protein